MLLKKPKKLIHHFIISQELASKLYHLWELHQMCRFDYLFRFFSCVYLNKTGITEIDKRFENFWLYFGDFYFLAGRLLGFVNEHHFKVGRASRQNRFVGRDPGMQVVLKHVLREIFNSSYLFSIILFITKITSEPFLVSNRACKTLEAWLDAVNIMFENKQNHGSTRKIFQPVWFANCCCCWPCGV